jgi:dolichol-phosphate mannosyltransferase
MGSEPEPFAVVIAAYNEGAAVRVHLEAVGSALARIAGNHALVVVDDGSSDDTTAGIAAASIPPSVDVAAVRHEQNRGYGAALRTGATRAAELGRAWVLFMDADGTNPPAHIERFVRAAHPGVDHLKGTRYGPDAAVVGVPAGRRLVSRAGNGFARLLLRTPPRDTTNGFRAIRTGPFLAMPLAESGFPIIMEELRWAYRAGLHGRDVPTTLSTRADDQRASGFGYRPATIWRYARHVLAAAGDRVRRRSREGWNQS